MGRPGREGMPVPAHPQRSPFPVSWFPSELVVMHKQDPTGKGQCHRYPSQAWLHWEGRRASAYLLVGLKMKKELASGMGTAFSFSCSSARGRGRGLSGISGSSSSSSPAQGGKGKNDPEREKDCDLMDPLILIWHLCQKDCSTPRLAEGHHILRSSHNHVLAPQQLPCCPARDVSYLGSLQKGRGL